MARMSLFSAALCAGAFAASVALSSAAAPAALDMYVGARNVVQNANVSDCSAKAKTALNGVLHSAFEAGDGTNQWLGYGPADSAGHSSAAAAIHCYPIDHGYVVTFTCSVEVPPNPEMASQLCAKLNDAFGGGK